MRLCDYGGASWSGGGGFDRVAELSKTLVRLPNRGPVARFTSRTGGPDLI